MFYVDTAAEGAETGLSWDNAYKELHEALDNFPAGAVGEIRVAAGTYYPDTVNLDDSRDATFQMINCVAIYGGYPSGGGNRDLRQNVTTLSGDVNGDNTIKCYHVFYHDNIGLNKSAVLDGFTIEKGCSHDDDDNDWRFIRGGGMFNRSCSPTIRNCVFRDNYAQYSGGAIYSLSSSPIIINCVFHDNEANVYYGGGIYSNGSAGEIVNCTFVGNIAGTQGGAIRFGGTLTPTVANSIFWNNAAPTGPQLHATSSVIVEHSCVEGGYTGSGNIDCDNLNFGNAAKADFRLKYGSDGIDEGDNDFVSNVPKDIHGNVRILDGYNDGTVTVDMGAYEYGECNGNGENDQGEIDNGSVEDCNVNGYPDECDLACGASLDYNVNGVPDECDDEIVLYVDTNLEASAGKRLYMGKCVSNVD